MHPVLTQVIQAFRAAQDLAVSTLVNRLGIPKPTSNLNWAIWTQSEGTRYGLVLHEKGLAHGLYVRAHGYGVEMRFPDLTIDFDWGEKGEGNGFDVWRLWNHCCENRLFLDQVTHELLSLRVDRALAEGELVAEGNLVYLTYEHP